MDNNALNPATSGDPNRGKRKKKRIKVRIKMDDGRKKKQRRQNIQAALIIAFIVGLMLVAFVLYKMDQSSSPSQTESGPPPPAPAPE